MAVTEGTVSFRGHRTWYRSVGNGRAGRPPLLVVAGGPGCPHDYLNDLAALYEETGRQVVFYDQIGCGRSDHPDDPALWTMSTFVDELAAVRAALGLDPVHVLGHSWGSQIALEYVLTRPVGLAGLVLAGPIASAPAYQAETRRLKDSLPGDVRETLDRHEAAGTTDDPEYQAAAMAFHQRWLCRLDPWPAHLVRSFTSIRPDVYEALWGGTEWNLTGSLKDWDVTGRLGEIDLPVLVTSGRHDVATPALVRPLAEGIRGAEWVVFEESAHIPSAEEPGRYRRVLADFLAAADPAPVARAA
ncbi:proline iminopeptidase-family hydrolase [Streptomyces sp. NK15101]|uniref:proline iminopeptidase-family hydrolase n=1 Tax=Streptomyces sp. NK15101 TaxID=2873261 RepID=UPI001CED077F|nr:proline iminopeptidase-family hydrolase [Streptomyces sp. NK15101]